MASSILLKRIQNPIQGIVGVRHASSGKLGFIGLGNMGNYMAKNLITRYGSLIVYDIQSDATSSLKELGANVAGTPAEVAEQADRVITMLPNCRICRNVYSGPNGVFEGAKPGTLFLDSSTIDPDTSKEIAVLAKAKNTTYLDCPVSGGTGAAKAGTLTFMVGGPPKEYKDITEILFSMGSKVVHCGPVGTGQVAKICNNMLLGITMIGTAEAMNLAIKMGLDPKLIAGILNSSTGRCWSSEIYNPVPGVLDNVPASNGYKGGFGTALMTKDLGLAQNAASGSATPTPLGALSYQIYQMMCSQGYKSKDFSAIYQFLQEQTLPETND